MTAPNVLLVIMDCVRAGNASLYGHEHRTTSFLEEFASRSTVYTHAFAPGTWSLPSHASIFTGRHVAEHGLNRARHRLEPGHTIFEELAAEGYDTGVFTENPWLTEMDVGLKDAFDTVEGSRNVPFPEALSPKNFLMSEVGGGGQYLTFLRQCLDDDYPVQSLLNGAHFKFSTSVPEWLDFVDETPASVYADVFLDWEREREGPWAACLNFMDAHHPYQPEDEFDRWGGSMLRSLERDIEDPAWEFHGGERPWWQRRALEGLYDGAIAQMDHALDRLVSTLEDRDVFEDTLLVVTSDHGEGFGEPSRLRPDTRIASHSAGLHETLLHVPLVVHAPGQEEGRVVEEPASLTQTPAAVRAALDGAGDADRGFVPEGEVLASFHGLVESMERRARRHVDDLWPYNGEALAVVTDEGDGVRKYATWREERSATVQIPDAKASYGVDGADARERVERSFDDLSAAGIIDADSGSEVSEDTKQRLEHLGYR